MCLDVIEDNDLVPALPCAHEFHPAVSQGVASEGSDVSVVPPLYGGSVFQFTRAAIQRMPYACAVVTVCQYMHSKEVAMTLTATTAPIESPAALTTSARLRQNPIFIRLHKVKPPSPKKKNMNVDVASVGTVGFTLLSPEIIRRMSVCCVTEPMLYDKGLPRQNSVLDLRLGTTDRRFLCSTCKHDMRACSGHFGHIDLALPLFNPVYIELTLKVLRCVCYFCSGLLVPPRRHRRLAELTSHAMKCRSVNRVPDVRRRAAVVEPRGNHVAARLWERRAFVLRERRRAPLRRGAYVHGRRLFYLEKHFRRRPGGPGIQERRRRWGGVLSTS